MIVQDATRQPLPVRFEEARGRLARHAGDLLRARARVVQGHQDLAQLYDEQVAYYEHATHLDNEARQRGRDYSARMSRQHRERACHMENLDV